MHSEEALESHYRAVLEAAGGFPVWLYNLPKFAVNNLSVALVTRLAREYENCVGLKDSSGDLLTMCAVNHLQDGRFNTAIGPDNLILAGLAMGLDCSVSGNSNHFRRLWLAFTLPSRLVIWLARRCCKGNSQPPAMWWAARAG